MRPAREPPVTVVAVAGDGSETVVGCVCVREPDLALVDALLRLALSGRRRGSAVCVRDVPEELRALLEFAGLADVLGL